MKTSTEQKLLINQSLSCEEIDLRQLVGALTRGWAWIAGGSTIGLILSSLYLLTTKPVYQGEFQIVLNQGNSQNNAGALLSQNPALAALAGFGGTIGNDSIATEV